MKWILGIAGIIIAISGGIGVGKVTAGSDFDYETASLEERQAWLEQGISELREGAEQGLRASGTSYNMMGVKDVTVSAEDNRVTLTIEAKGSTRLAIPSNFRVEYMDKMCGEWMRTAPGRKGVLMTTRIVRSNGDLVRSDTISKPACERFKEFKKRAA